MIYGFNDTDKSKQPINLKYEGDGEVIGIEPDGTQTELTTIKRIIPIQYTNQIDNGHFVDVQLSQNIGFVDPQKCVAIVYAKSKSSNVSDVVTIEAVFGLNPITDSEETIIGYAVYGSIYHAYSSDIDFSGYIIELN